MRRALTVVMLLILVAFICICFGCGGQRIDQQVTPIVSLDRSSGVYGSFSLGFGVVGTSACYFAYKQNGPDKFELIQIPATGPQSVKTEVIESGKNIVVTFEHQSQFFGYWQKDGGGLSRYEIHVPKGTIIKEFRP
jgi:hypothetical protein